MRLKSVARQSTRVRWTDWRYCVSWESSVEREVRRESAVLTAVTTVVMVVAI
jgi:hypothetical protein